VPSPDLQTAWQGVLRQHGYRVTPQRQLVLEAVDKLRHATPEEILQQVQSTARGVNLSTVYRTLEVLEDVGLVTHTHIGHGAPTYHALDEHAHIHLVCSKCEQVTSIPASVAQSLVADLKKKYGFTTDISHFAIQGVCADCARQ